MILSCHCRPVIFLAGALSAASVLVAGLCASANAATVRGDVLRDNRYHDPLEYAEIELCPPGSSEFCAATFTGRGGRFYFDSIPGDRDYELKISIEGLQIHSEEIWVEERGDNYQRIVVPE